MYALIKGPLEWYIYNEHSFGGHIAMAISGVTNTTNTPTWSQMAAHWPPTDQIRLSKRQLDQ